MTAHTSPGDTDPGAFGQPGSSRRKMIWWIAGGIVLLALIVWLAHHRAASASKATGRAAFNGPMAVGVATVASGDIPITINALGTVTPLATVIIHPQINGPLVKIAFTEGQMVKRGDLLVQIDPRPYQAAVDQADGQLKRDQASLANAKVDVDRYKTLLAQNSVSDQTYATQVATVAQQQAVVASDKAALEAAQLNLDYCRITSPVAGLVGLRQVDVGNLMQAGSTTIAVVTQMQPMSVLFTVPEDSLRNILQRLREGQKLAVDAYDRSVTRKIASGTLSNADNQIDTSTGTLKLRAMFDNANFELFPNQFVNVRLLLDTLHDVIVVPGASMQQGASGSYVYVVNADSTVSMRAVQTGPSSGDLIQVTKGLQVGERVVVDGADQLRDGAKVVVPAPGAHPAGASGSSSGAQRGHRRGTGSSSGSGGYAGGGFGAHGGSSSGSASSSGSESGSNGGGGSGQAGGAAPP
ncbi:MAG TPA: efflux RND transporter periplasmic adaptor subunit [Steroidobacteraceae bacterium]